MMRHRWLSAVLATSSSLVMIGCNPAIYRAKGTVVSVRLTDRTQAEVCLERAVKAAGSTYGKAPKGGRICMDGVTDTSRLPTTGACVVLQHQGERSKLEIEPASDCP